MSFLLETKRLRLREFTLEDAPFILELLNTPDWIRFISDKGPKTLEEAQNYITYGPAKSYMKNGFGLWCVEQKSDGQAIGMCGLVDRPGLEDIDLGFAFLPAFYRKGYGFESAKAVLDFGWSQLQLKRIVAITIPENEGSIRLLEKLGFWYEKILPKNDSESDLMLYAIAQ